MWLHRVDEKVLAVIGCLALAFILFVGHHVVATSPWSVDVDVDDHATGCGAAVAVSAAVVVLLVLLLWFSGRLPVCVRLYVLLMATLLTSPALLVAVGTRTVVELRHVVHHIQVSTFSRKDFL